MPLLGSSAVRRTEIPWPAALAGPIRQILRPETYVGASLSRELIRLADPQQPLEADALLSLVAKYFFAYLHADSHDREVSLSDITRLFQSFARFRSGNPDTLPLDLVMKFSAWHVALRRLGDLPRTAALFRAIVDDRNECAGQECVGQECVDREFVGLDLGTGAGLFLVAQWLRARRLGVEEPRIFGLEADPQVARRTQALMGELGLGGVWGPDPSAEAADPSDPRVYTAFRGQPINFVSNETIPVVFKLQGGDEFLDTHRALFTTLGPEVEAARFFPELVCVDNVRHGVSLDLCPDNRFQVPERYAETPLYPRALILGGNFEPLEHVGRGYTAYIPPRCQHLLPRRW